jgi:2-polyprenyl-3-methyl-5-hydroxy-6-metoxy-1,4-benzoquinol methylase/ribosomal protein L32
MKCLVCDQSDTRCIYQNDRATSITSLCKRWEAPTTVHVCESCGHLQTQETLDLQGYYDDDYNINLASETEDQLYAVVDGKPVFRSEYQSRICLSRTTPRENARVLDYGCGSGHIARALTAQRDDLDMHLFDISDNYRSVWQTWLDQTRMSTYDLPKEWLDTFDLVVSFFALEHARSPRAFANQLFSAVKRGGRVYLVVPNVYQNIADLIVVDHINHFSQTSLMCLFQDTGFDVDEINDSDHESAWTVILRRPENTKKNRYEVTKESLDALLKRAESLATFWTETDARIADFEREHASYPSVIYGSGFYGSYLFTRMQQPERIDVFLDRNPHQQTKQLFDREIIDPLALDDRERVVWVGLNPRIARETIESIAEWYDRPYAYFYF